MMINPSVLKLIHDQQQQEIEKHIELDKFSNHGSSIHPLMTIEHLREWLKGRFSSPHSQETVAKTALHKESSPAPEKGYAKTCNPC